MGYYIKKQTVKKVGIYNMLDSKINNLVNSEETNVKLSVNKVNPRKKVLLGWDEDTLLTIKKESESELKTNISNGKYSVANSFIINSTEASNLVNKVFYRNNHELPMWSRHLNPREVLSLMVYAINISGDITYNNYGKGVELSVPARAFYINNFSGWRKALDLVGLTKNKIEFEVESKLFTLPKEEMLSLKIKGLEYARYRGNQKYFWGADLKRILKKTVNPKLKTTIADGKYFIYSDFVLTSEDAEILSTLCYLHGSDWKDSLTPKDVLSLLAYAINISGFSSLTKYRDDVPLRIPGYRFYYTHFGSWSNTLSLLGLTEN